MDREDERKTCREAIRALFREWPRVRTVAEVVARIGARWTMPYTRHHPEVAGFVSVVVAGRFVHGGRHERPDRGIVAFATDGSGGHEVVGAAVFSNEGEHWRGPVAYDDGPFRVHARQHTHPQPTCAHDLSCVVFTSDRSGHAQACEVGMA